MDSPPRQGRLPATFLIQVSGVDAFRTFSLTAHPLITARNARLWAVSDIPATFLIQVSGMTFGLSL
jgi:hypothetical protein